MNIYKKTVNPKDDLDIFSRKHFNDILVILIKIFRLIKMSNSLYIYKKCYIIPELI
jgi:hypothetical protein